MSVRSLFVSSILTISIAALGHTVRAQPAPDIPNADNSSPASAIDQVSQPQYEVIVEKNIPIVTRDGTTLYADVYRPDASGKFPVLVAHAPYQKDIDEVFPKPVPGYPSREMPMVSYFVPRGYAIVRVDPRGVGRSEGQFGIFTRLGAEDAYDTIEWSAQQPWSTGKTSIGGGVGYYSIASWLVAALRPPHLTTMLSWDGDADIYRGLSYRGGIYFQQLGEYYENVAALQLLHDDPLYNRDGFTRNFIAETLQNSLVSDAIWEGRIPDLSKIDIPVLMTESWGVNTIHGRGNIEAYYRMREMGKQNIKLRVHDNHNKMMYPGGCQQYGDHTCAFFSEEGLLEQLRWYDYWLKGIDTGVMDEPPVKLWVRSGPDSGMFRFEEDWPLPSTQWTKLYLSNAVAGVHDQSVNDGSLSLDASGDADSVTFTAGPFAYARTLGMGLPTASFSTSPMENDQEVSGPIALKLWVSSETTDMDIVAHVRDIAPDGSVDNLADGWLKVSRRKLDHELTRKFRPFHTHDEELKMVPGEIYEVEIEIWPISHVFKKGHRLWLDIDSSPGGFFKHARYKNGSTNTIYFGEGRRSYLLIPLIPARK